MPKRNLTARLACGHVPSNFFFAIRFCTCQALGLSHPKTSSEISAALHFQLLMLKYSQFGQSERRKEDSRYAQLPSLSTSFNVGRCCKSHGLGNLRATPPFRIHHQHHNHNTPRRPFLSSPPFRSLPLLWFSSALPVPSQIGLNDPPSPEVYSIEGKIYRQS